MSTTKWVYSGSFLTSVGNVNNISTVLIERFTCPSCQHKILSLEHNGLPEKCDNCGNSMDKTSFVF